MEERTKDEERVVSKIMEGNIRYCLEIIQKAQAKKAKHLAVVDLAGAPGSDGSSEDSEEEGSSEDDPFKKKKQTKDKVAK